MTKQEDKHIIGIYPDLTAEGGSDFATDVLETDRYERLIEQGYQVVGTIDGDTTEGEIQAIAQRIAEKRVPPEDSPVWDALADYVYNQASPHNKVLASLGENGIKAFEEELAQHIAGGGNEDEFCLSRLREIEERWKQNG